MYTIHATKKLRDRVKAPRHEPVEAPTTALGNWYATGLFWKPQVALFVNEATLVPVLMPRAPAKTLDERLPDHLQAVLNALGTDPRFVAAEVTATADARWAKTANRSVVRIMNEFTSSPRPTRPTTAARTWCHWRAPGRHPPQPALQAAYLPRQRAPGPRGNAAKSDQAATSTSS